MNRPKGTGCIYRREGSAFWWIKYSRNGKPFLESSHSTEKSRAKNLLKKRLGEIENGSFIGPKSERTMVSDLVEDLFREYRINGLKSLDDAKARWDLHLEKFFRGRRAVDVSSSLLKEYQDKRQEESASNASINRELAVLRRMFTLGRQHRKVREIPIFPHLRENNTRKGFLEDGAFRKIVESRRELWFRCIVELGKTYGWRISELLNLRVKQVDLFSRTIRLEVGTTKNDEGREVTMTDSVSTLLSECIHNKRPDDYCFTRPNGKPVRDFRDTWYSACCAANLGKLSCPQCGNTVEPDRHCSQCTKRWPASKLRYRGLIFHDLRRTAARNMRRAGIAEEVIMKIGGWKTSAVFKRYSIVDQTDIQEATKRIQERERNADIVAEQRLQNGYSEPQASSVAKGRTVN
jgi:integrase